MPSTSRLFVAESQGAREEQQDASVVLYSPQHGNSLLVVSDGVGGHQGGQIASRKIVELARKLWEERGGELSDAYADLALLCKEAHDQMNQEGEKLSMAPRATVVALYLTSTHAFWIHSGDSRLYHFRKDQLLHRTKDHSMLQLMVKQGMVKEEEMGRHPDQAALLQSLGGEEYKEPTQDQCEIAPEDGFLLCTDGFWERTLPEEMAALLVVHGDQAQELLQKAVDRAVKRNGPRSDNVTVAIALPETPGPPPPINPAPAAFLDSSAATVPLANKRVSVPPPPGTNIIMWATIILSILGLALAIIWMFLPKMTSSPAGIVAHPPSNSEKQAPPPSHAPAPIPSHVPESVPAPAPAPLSPPTPPSAPASPKQPGKNSSSLPENQDGTHSSGPGEHQPKPAS